MLELGDMSFSDRWLQCCIRFWNRILPLSVDDLYRDVLSDSVLNNVGLARGLQERMCDIGFPLSLQQPHLPRINEESVAAQLRHRQQDSLEASLGVDPRTCRSEGAAICTYWRWFRRADGQQGHRLRAGVSVMPPHPRGHMSFCAFGWYVILYRQSPDAVLEFHDPSDYAC